MPSEITIESPNTLATLPQPLDQSNGKTLAANVLGVKYDHSSFKRRKRTEVAVGIDGVGINLYDVLSPRLITSYSLPPQAIFTCPPCSIRENNGDRLSKQRLSYASIRTSKPQITLFRQGSSRTSIVTATYNIPKVASPVKYLDVLPHQSAHREAAPSMDVLAVHEDGQIRCLKGDLSKELWVTQAGAIASVINPATGKTSGIYVEHIVITDAATAKKGLLKEREDLQAFLAPLREEGSQQGHQESSLREENLRLKALPVLVIIGRPCTSRSDHDPRMVYVFCIRDRSRINLSTENSASLHSLASYELPKPDQLPARSLLVPQYSLDPAKGALSVLLADQIVTYDLSSTLPKLSSELYVGRTKFSSFVRLSTSSVLTTSSNGIGVYDTNFQSLQASLAFNEALSFGLDTKKRKLVHPAESPYSHIKVFSYLKNLDLVVGLADGALIGFQVSSSSTTGVRDRKRRRSGLLIDAIGRGLERPATEATLLPPIDMLPQKVISGYVPGFLSKGNKTLAVIREELDGFVKSGDVESFERTVANVLGIERDETPLREWNTRKNTWERDHASKAVNGIGMANGVKTNSSESILPSSSAECEVDFSEDRPLPAWKTTGADSGGKDVMNPHGEVIWYIINKLFRWTTEASSVSPLNPESTKEPSLDLTFYAPNVFKWLVESRGFSFNLFRQMLQRQQGNMPSIQVMARATINVFASFDPELRLLHSLLLGPVFFGPIQLTEVIRHVLRSLEFVERKSASAGPECNGGGDPHVNGNLDAALSQEESAAEVDIGFALNTLEFGSAIREQTLTLALLRLNVKPASEITKALRSQLTLGEITILIQILRKELATGGWTSRYLDADPHDSQASADDDDAHEDRSVGLIVNLLNCAIDAISIPGWALNNLEENEDLIAMLKFEVSAALEGIEEATYARGLLQEILRYQRSVGEAFAQSSGKGEKAQGMNKPITLPIEGQQKKRVLPLGLKVERDVDRTKVGAGGELSKRSARDLGRLKSRMVGLYSRERILF